MTKDIEETLQDMKRTLEEINRELQDAIKAISDCSDRHSYDSSSEHDEYFEAEAELYEVFGGD